MLDRQALEFKKEKETVDKKYMMNISSCEFNMGR
jgi:hypothetical protein